MRPWRTRRPCMSRKRQICQPLNFVPDRPSPRTQMVLVPFPNQPFAGWRKSVGPRIGSVEDPRSQTPDPIAARSLVLVFGPPRPPRAPLILPWHREAAAACVPQPDTKRDVGQRGDRVADPIEIDGRRRRVVRRYVRHRLQCRRHLSCRCHGKCVR